MSELIVAAGTLGAVVYYGRFWVKRRNDMMDGLLAEIAAVKYANTVTSKKLHWTIVGFRQTPLRDVTLRLEQISKTLLEIHNLRERERITPLVLQALCLQRPVAMLWFGYQWETLHGKSVERLAKKKREEFLAALSAD